jgi:hypothetical protein
MSAGELGGVSFLLILFIGVLFLLMDWIRYQ